MVYGLQQRFELNAKWQALSLQQQQQQQYLLQKQQQQWLQQQQQTEASVKGAAASVSGLVRQLGKWVKSSQVCVFEQTV